MKITVRDLQDQSAQRRDRSFRLSKPTIDLDTAPYAILILRISLGLLFLAHGLLKLLVFTLPFTSQFFDSVGLPGFMAYLVAPMEIVGGLLLKSRSIYPLGCTGFVPNFAFGNPQSSRCQWLAVHK